jgi:hypothetical protein
MNQEVDFGILTVREIRDVLKSKAHCLRAGFPPDHMIIKTLNEFRDHYLTRVGLPTYLNQMLGELGKVQMQYCSLYDEKGQQINVHLKGAHNQPVQRFLARNFSVHELPFKIEIASASNSGGVEVRYL